MSTRRKICELSELQGGAVFFEALVRGETRSCFAVSTASGPTAFLNVCAHRNQPVVVDESEPFTGEFIECRAHGAMYDPVSGECVEGPCAGARLVSVALAVEKDEVFAVDDDLFDDSIYADEEG